MIGIIIFKISVFIYRISHRKLHIREANWNNTTVNNKTYTKWGVFIFFCSSGLPLRIECNTVKQISIVGIGAGRKQGEMMYKLLKDGVATENFTWGCTWRIWAALLKGERKQGLPLHTKAACPLGHSMRRDQTPTRTGQGEQKANGGEKPRCWWAGRRRRWRLAPLPQVAFLGGKGHL